LRHGAETASWTLPTANNATTGYWPTAAPMRTVSTADAAPLAPSTPSVETGRAIPKKPATIRSTPTATPAVKFLPPAVTAPSTMGQAPQTTWAKNAMMATPSATTTATIAATPAESWLSAVTILSTAVR